MKEIWKDIPEYEGLYQVSIFGKVRSLYGWNGTNYYRRNKILKPEIIKGYLRVSLFKKNKCKKFMIHRLVAEAFLPNVNNLPYINHKDENTKNNKVFNLEWCTHDYNVRYSQSKKILQYDLQGNFVKEWNAVNDIVRETKITHVCDCCKGKRNHAGGYIWKYKD